MLYQFAPAIQAGINSGIYEIVRDTATGQLLGIARDKATGHFVAHAVGFAAKNGFSINPLFAPAQFAVGGLQMAQTHLGFQKAYKMLNVLQNSVGVLQASTALIGVGTVAGIVLSAVNLHQTLKLREDVKQLRLEVKDGFIDLKQALNDGFIDFKESLEEQKAEILQHIDRVAQDVEFRHHRTILAQAYGYFIQASIWLKDALKLPDETVRNVALAGVEGMLRKALADYNNPELYKDICTAGRLRRLECAWAIDQTITLIYQLQGAYEAVSDRLSNLQNTIRQETLSLVELCKTDDELDFLFPELVQIHEHDLAILETWQKQIDWQRSLSPSELKLLHSVDLSSSEVTVSSNESADTITDLVPPELLLYTDLKQKSHLLSLRDQLKFLLKPDLRREHESYISQQAVAFGYKALAPSNWQEVPDLTVANLYWYFKNKKNKQEAILSKLSLTGYKKLQELLVAGEWKKANEETTMIMLKIAARSEQGYFEVKNIEKFPNQDLHTIDQLWVAYSNGRFGFSIQKCIWQKVREDWHNFGTSAGWGKLDKWQSFKWIFKDELTFSMNAPRGHLPAVFPCVNGARGFSACVVWSLLLRRDLIANSRDNPL